MKKQKIINKKRLLMPLQRQNRAGCSDKKLLWRANLYVDERAKDWNDLHPWTYANGNTWDVGAYLPGMQQNILPWTRFSDHETIANAVAYGWGCNDNFAEFNSELLLQQDAIQRYHQAVVDDYCSENSITQAEIDVAALPTDSEVKFSLNYLDHDNTTAPNDNWDNYTFASRRISTTTELSKTFNYWNYKAILSDTILEQLNNPEQHNYYLHENLSVPGFSTFMAFCEDENNERHNKKVDSMNPNDWNYQYNQATLTSGIDCSGFAERAADYMGSEYVITGENETAAKVNTSAFANNTNSWLIQEGNVNRDGKNNIIPGIPPTPLLNLNTLVPGDILVWGGHHVVIVQNIEYPNGERVIENINQIKIIQSSNSEYVFDVSEGKMKTYWNVWNTNISVCDYTHNYDFRRLRR